jgi:pimeloyl-ACP methyl ester carboxylesterase
MYFKTTGVAGLGLFYREAGDPSKPTIVLLHGFPSSSYQFHELIPRLAHRFHVIAPDYPGMGYSEAPAPTALRPTFDDVATVIDAFIAAHATGPLILYLHDIGGPIGVRIARAHPERIAGLIFQNFTMSVEGWNPERLKIYERLGGPEPQRSWPRQSNLPLWNALCFSTKRARASLTPSIPIIETFSS